MQLQNQHDIRLGNVRNWWKCCSSERVRRQYVTGAKATGGRSHFFRLRLRSCSKILNPGQDQGPAIFQIWESDSCSDSSYNHQSNVNLSMFLLKKWQPRLLHCLRYSGSGPTSDHYPVTSDHFLITHFWSLSTSDHYPITEMFTIRFACWISGRMVSLHFATRYGYPQTHFKREPGTDKDIRNAFLDISRIHKKCGN